MKKECGIRPNLKKESMEIGLMAKIKCGIRPNEKNHSVELALNVFLDYFIKHSNISKKIEEISPNMNHFSIQCSF